MDELGSRMLAERVSHEASGISENDQKRSDYVCNFVKQRDEWKFSKTDISASIPRTIVQYWDAPKRIPPDVQECMASWERMTCQGFTHLVFDDLSARQFIAENLADENVAAYSRCYHPAMKSDYFRLCYIYCCGGMYVDVDDIHNGNDLEHLFGSRSLKLQPLCYDIPSDSMVKPDLFLTEDGFSRDWIFYFNNNPIIAPAFDPIVKYALCRSTNLLLSSIDGVLPEIQSTTGPGNLTASTVAKLFDCDTKGIEVLSDWERFAITKWELDYRKGARNWRLSNSKQFIEVEGVSDESNKDAWKTTKNVQASEDVDSVVIQQTKM